MVKSEEYFPKQRAQAITAFKALDAVYLDLNEKCIREKIASYHKDAAELLDTKSSELETSLPIFDDHHITTMHGDNTQAATGMFKSSSGRFDYHALYKQALQELARSSKQGLKDLKVANTRRIKKSVDPVLREIKALLKRNPSLTQCALGMWEGSCVTWFTDFVREETNHRLKKEWGGDKTKTQHGPKVVEMFFRTDLRRYLQMNRDKDGAKNQKRNVVVVVSLLVAVMGYFWLTSKKRS